MRLLAYIVYVLDDGFGARRFGALMCLVLLRVGRFVGDGDDGAGDSRIGERWRGAGVVVLRVDAPPSRRGDGGAGGGEDGVGKGVAVGVLVGSGEGDCVGVRKGEAGDGGVGDGGGADVGDGIGRRCGAGDGNVGGAGTSRVCGGRARSKAVSTSSS